MIVMDSNFVVKFFSDASDDLIMAPSLLQGRNALVIITGASRGIGRELAIQLAKVFSDVDSTFFLLARDVKALNEVKSAIIKETLSATVELLVTDLSQPYTGQIDETIRSLEEKNTFDVRVVVHNAGTMGDLTKKSSELNDEAQWHSYLQTNLFSTITLNNKIFAALQDDELHGKTIVVNITSLLSVMAFPSFTQYSVGKAAREAYFRALAVEHPECKVLNYAPGPVDTKMHEEICEMSYDSSVRDLFGKREETNVTLHRKLLSPEETARKLVKILEDNKFESGARIDYFDN